MERIVATLVVFFLLLTGCKANNTGDFQEDNVGQMKSGVQTDTKVLVSLKFMKISFFVEHIGFPTLHIL